MDDKLIEEVARQTCINLGLDPDVCVDHWYMDDMTPKEQSEAVPFVPETALYSPRWRLYRFHAATAIATSIALSQTEYDLAVHKRMDDALARWLAEPETAKLLTEPHPALTQKEPK